jgi:hypothetical protein
MGSLRPKISFTSKGEAFHFYLLMRLYLDVVALADKRTSKVEAIAICQQKAKPNRPHFVRRNTSDDKLGGALRPMRPWPV